MKNASGLIGIAERFLKLPVAVKVLIVCVAAAGGWFAYSRIRSVRDTAPSYTLTTVERGTVVSSVAASGSVLVSNIRSVNTQASGTVSRVYVKNGDTVREGQTIAEVALDTQGKQAQDQSYAAYLSAKNNSDAQEATLHSLNSAMWVAQQKFVHGAAEDDKPADDPVYIQQNSDWLAAEAKYKNQQGVIAQARVSLAAAWSSYVTTRGTITVPQGGTVTGLNIAEGMQIGTSDSATGNRLSSRVAAIKSEGMPLISLTVSEIDVSRIEPGQKVTVTADSLPEKTFTGTIASVDKIGSVSGGVTSYPVIVRLDTESPDILPNMSVTGNIITAAKTDALTVPAGAVTEEDGVQSVRVPQNGGTRTVIVETGIASDTMIEILSGLNEGDQVVTGSGQSQPAQGGSASPFGGGFGGGGIRMIR